MSRKTAKHQEAERLVEFVGKIDQEVLAHLENKGGISLAGLADLVTKHVPIANAIRSEDEIVGLPYAYMENAIELIESWPSDDAPWAHLFTNPNISVALDYGFALGLRFAHERQQRKAKVKS